MHSDWLFFKQEARTCSTLVGLEMFVKLLLMHFLLEIGKGGVCFIANTTKKKTVGDIIKEAFQLCLSSVNKESVNGIVLRDSSPDLIERLEKTNVWADSCTF